MVASTHYVDSREKDTDRVPIKRLAKAIGFVEMKLDFGDYGTEKAVIERKQVNDFINSCFARGGEPPRIYRQIDGIMDMAEKQQVIPMLLITGRLSTTKCPSCQHLFEGADADFKKRWKEQFGQERELNKNAVYGAVASIKCRYAIDIFWTDQPIIDWLKEIKSYLEKVDEGKHLIPHRRKLKEFAKTRNTAIIARTFDITPSRAEVFEKKYCNLIGVINALKNQPKEVACLDGIGERTIQRMKEIAGIV